MMLGRYAAARREGNLQRLECGCKKEWWRIVLLKVGAA